MGILIFAGRELTASQIIALAEPLGVASANVKSHLTRMVADGTLTRSGRARHSTYGPSDLQEARIEDLRERLRTKREAWDGAWILVAGYSPRNRAQKEHLHGALWMDGFRMANGVFIRPAWPVPWAEQRGSAFAELMEGISLRGTITSSAIDLADLYDLSELDSEATALADEIGKFTIPPSPSECFTALLQVSGRVVQLASHNPLLPPELVRVDGLFQLLKAFRSMEATLAPAAFEFLGGVLSGLSAGSAGRLTTHSPHLPRRDDPPDG